MHSPLPAPKPEDTQDADLGQADAPEVGAPQAGDEQNQTELYAAYILQQKRMRCPGCGEGDEIF